MAPIEFYPGLKQAHIALASASVALFCARGIGVLAGARWPMAAAVRHASAAIDTLLISAGGLLWWLLQLDPRRDGWLMVKLLLIVTYIVVGSFALKRAPTRVAKALAFLASLLCIASVAAIALRHDPLGPWRMLGLG